MKKIACFTIIALILSFAQVTAAQVTFSPAPSEGGQEKVYLTVLPHEQNLIEVQIFGKDILSPILGLAFDLNFDNQLLAYAKYQPGSFLETGGQPIYLISQATDQSGRLIVGLSLKRGDSLPKGSGQFMSIFFKILKSGQSSMQFSNVSLASLDIQKKNLDNVSWLGGNLQFQANDKINLSANLLDKIPKDSLRLIFEFILLLIVIILSLKKYKKS